MAGDQHVPSEWPQIRELYPCNVRSIYTPQGDALFQQQAPGLPCVWREVISLHSSSHLFANLGLEEEAEVGSRAERCPFAWIVLPFLL